MHYDGTILKCPKVKAKTAYVGYKSLSSFDFLAVATSWSKSVE